MGQPDYRLSLCITVLFMILWKEKEKVNLYQENKSKVNGLSTYKRAIQ